jgi:RNA polymerase sigma factor (sigma-70 family)
MRPTELTSRDTLDLASLRRLLMAQSDQLSGYLARHLPPGMRRFIEPRDILQDVFFEAFQRLPEFSPADDEASSRWLMTIARNRLVDLIRMHKSAKRGGGGAIGLGDEELRHISVVLLLKDLAVHYRTPSRSASRREVIAMIEQSMRLLRPEYREAVELRFLMGLSLKETAIQMKRTEDSAQKLCGRALDALRTEMRSASLYF